jgi:hypothetical protein
MRRETDTVKLLKTLLGLYEPNSEEVQRLAEIAELNKLLLAYLRMDALRDQLVCEEARYGWFMDYATEVVEVLENAGAAYALYKFKRPFEHVSVDLDIFVRVGDDVPRLLEPWSLGVLELLSGSLTQLPSLWLGL